MAPTLAGSYGRSLCGNYRLYSESVFPRQVGEEVKNISLEIDDAVVPTYCVDSIGNSLSFSGLRRDGSQRNWQCMGLPQNTSYSLSEI